MADIASIIKNHFNSEYKKGFALIFSSKVVLTLVTFFVTPILSRLYSPADYGLFALMNSMAVLFSLISNFTLPGAILVEKDEKIKDIFISVLIISFSGSVIFLIASFYSLSHIQSLTFLSDYPVDFWFISIIIAYSFLITVSQLLANLNIRQKKFKTNVIVNVFDNISVRIFSISFGFAGRTLFGFIYSESIGRLLNIICQFYFKRKTFNVKYFLKSFDLKKSFSTLKEFRNYLLYNLPSSLIGSFHSQIILWTLALVFSSETLGLFTMSIALLNIPQLLFANAFQPLVTSKLHNEYSREVASSIKEIIIKIAVVSFLIYSVIYIVAPYFVMIYLGGTWQKTAEFIRMMCLPFAFQLVGSSISGSFLVFKKQRAYFVIKSTFLLLLFGIFYLLIKFEEQIDSFVIAYSVLIAVEEFIKLFYLLIRLKNVESR